MREIYRINYAIVILSLSALLFSCRGEHKASPEKTSEKQSTQQIDRDLEDIKKDGVLTVITLYNSTSYFLYRGKTMGFEYEMVERLAESLGLELRIKVADKFEDLITMLRSGKGDMIAFGLSITKERKKQVAFSEYHYLTHQVLVQRMPKNWRRLPGYKIKRQLVNDPIELIGDTIHVRKNTSYYDRVQNLEEEIGGEIHVEPVSGNRTTDDIIKMVADGKIDYTIADDNMASINKTYHPNLNIDTDMSFSQRVAWSVRKNSPELLKEINKWINKSKKKNFYYVLYNKYFKNKRRYRRQIASDFYSKNQGKISPYDKIIRDNSKKLNWDWRLVSSLVYQESRFDPHNKSWAGAGGLMQIMPKTAEELGLQNMADPNDNLRAGTSYLHKLYKRFDKVEDSTQRIKLTMAAYNCGFGHVRDAQRLAEAYDKKPTRWDDNVEEFILKLQKREYFNNPQVHYGFVRGREPYNYVRDIFRRYEHYRKLIPLEQKEDEKQEGVASN